MDQLNLYHYTSKQLVPDKRTYDYDDDSSGGTFKPRGLWVSVDDDWIKWCESSRYNLGGWNFKSKIVINNNADILLLQNSEQLKKFTKEFLSDNKLGIDWIKVSNRYQGIIVINYHRYRLIYFWLNSWDCNSGCIWDSTAYSLIDAN
jgi:hypothetical protein